jgi:hypothetical protein
MQIVTNTTGFPAELFVSTDKDGQKRCVVVVKATFDVSPDGECQAADEQAPFVHSDEHYGDPGESSVRYECDFVPVKSRADVLVNGEAIVPNGHPVSALEVTLAGPGINKRVLVTGDRVWEDRISGTEASVATPFSSMPLIWERAFGGSDSTHEDESKNGSELGNLVGVGFHLNSDVGTILGTALPNIEDPNEPVSAWSDKPPPKGFGPVGRAWQPRVGFAGTYDDHWLKETRPFLPQDFDDRYFQAAPLDQQLPQLQPGAGFRCANMSAGGGFVAYLPVLQVPVRFRLNDRTESCTVVCDTLILEPGAARLILVGRCSVALPRKLTSVREIEVGHPKRSADPKKTHFTNLPDAIAAIRERR